MLSDEARRHYCCRSDKVVHTKRLPENSSMSFCMDLLVSSMRSVSARSLISNWVFSCGVACGGVAHWVCAKYNFILDYAGLQQVVVVSIKRNALPMDHRRTDLRLVADPFGQGRLDAGRHFHRQLETVGRNRHHAVDAGQRFPGKTPRRIGIVDVYAAVQILRVYICVYVYKSSVSRERK